MNATSTDSIITRCSFARFVTLHARLSGYPDPERRNLDRTIKVEVYGFGQIRSR